MRQLNENEPKFHTIVQGEKFTPILPITQFSQETNSQILPWFHRPLTCVALLESKNTDVEAVWCMLRRLCLLSLSAAPTQQVFKDVILLLLVRRWGRATPRRRRRRRCNKYEELSWDRIYIDDESALRYDIFTQEVAWYRNSISAILIPHAQRVSKSFNKLG